MRLNRTIKDISFSKLKRITNICFFGLGIIFFILIVLSFTTLPFWMYYNLGKSTNTLPSAPEYIVVLGGGGMPSESGLMRTYRAAELYNKYPSAKLIIALPGEICDQNSSINLMKKELVLRGIDSMNIILENKGCNTRMQALNIRNMIDCSAHIIIVSSPDHMYRAIKTFKKAGLEFASGKPAFEQAIESSLELNEIELGGNKFLVSVGNNQQFRYQFWNHMKYQIMVYREYAAICYYKLRGWI